MMEIIKVSLAAADIRNFLPKNLFHAVSYFFGGFSDKLIAAMVILSVIDYITGVIKAILRKELSSDIGFRGIIRKCMMFMLVGVANIIDVHLLTMLTLTGTDGGLLRDTVLLFFIVNECVSVLENAVSGGVPVPEKLREVLKQLNSGGKSHDAKTGEKNESESEENENENDENEENENDESE